MGWLGGAAVSLTKTETCRPRRGAALVELALVLPLLIVLVLGCVDFGRFASSYSALTNAAREGASFGSRHPFTTGTYGTWKRGVTRAVTKEMEGIPGYAADRLEIDEPRVMASQVASFVRVRVSYTFEPAVAWPALPHEVEMSRTVDMPLHY